MAWGAVASSARAAFCTEMPDFIRGDSVCPHPKAVEAEVFKLTSPEGRAAYLPGARVRIFDAGPGYSVEIEKDDETYRKTYDDPARGCDQRARVVAVTVVMTLIPPELAAEPTEAAPPAPGDAPAAAQADVAESRSEAPPVSVAKREPSWSVQEAPELAGLAETTSLSFQLDAGVWFHHSLSSSEVPRIAAGGGELTAALGSGRVAGLLSVSAGASRRFELGEIGVSMSEATARAGARVLWPIMPMTFAFDAAFVIARRRVSAEAPKVGEAADAAAAWELGGAAGVNVAVQAWRSLAPVAGVRLEVFPAPSQLEAAPRGVIATLPVFWVGAHAGVRFEP